MLLLPDSLHIVWTRTWASTKHLSLGLEKSELEVEEISRKVLSTKDDFLELILKTMSDEILSSTNFFTSYEARV